MNLASHGSPQPQRLPSAPPLPSPLQKRIELVDSYAKVGVFSRVAWWAAGWLGDLMAGLHMRMPLLGAARRCSVQHVHSCFPPPPPPPGRQVIAMIEIEVEMDSDLPAAEVLGAWCGWLADGSAALHGDALSTPLGHALLDTLLPPPPPPHPAGIEEQIQRLSEIESLQEEWQLQVGGAGGACRGAGGGPCAWGQGRVCCSWGNPGLLQRAAVCLP